MEPLIVGNKLDNPIILKGNKELGMHFSKVLYKISILI